MSRSPQKLNSKLARLKSAGGPRKSTLKATPESSLVDDDVPNDARIDSLRSRMSQLRRGKKAKDKATGKSKKRKKGVWVAPQRVGLPGEWVETKFGGLQKVVSEFSVSHEHGEYSLAGALEAAGDGVARLSLDDELQEFDPRTALFLDTETTGLAGGSGTVPFLIGIGFFTDTGFVVEQLLLKEMGQEKPLLRYLAQKIEQATSLVSFNGKSYDWPLLRTRFVMNRVKLPKLPPHFDLLHSSRRIFKHQLDQTKLTTLEREVLQFHRVGDIPGAEIPERFFTYLSTGEGELLSSIVEHNLHDILAMVALVGVLTSVIQTPHSTADGRVQLAVAQLQLRVKDSQSALQFVEAVCSSESEDRWKWEALVLGATILRRQAAFAASETLLNRAINLSGVKSEVQAPAHLMLAKLYEHHLRHYQKALKHAQLSLGAESESGLERRVTRIQRKSRT